MPRNRTVRAAVLGSSVQRAALPRYPSRSRPAVKRRVAAGVLVLLSLVLITLSFRAPEGGGLDNLQNAGATALRPFQVGIERLVRPFRDLYAYTTALVDAQAENERLRAELRRAQQQAIANRLAAQRTAELEALLDFRAPPSYPGDYDRIAAAVISYPPTPFEQHVVIGVGSSDGVRVNDPVVSGDGLVGRVTDVTSRTAKVTLLTDAESAVTALDVRTRALGIVKRDRAGSALLVMDNVGKRDIVSEGDRIVTAGSQRGQLPSLFPRGIPIGTVSFVGQSDIDLFKRVQVEPAVDLDSFDSVIVLVPKRSRG